MKRPLADKRIIGPLFKTNRSECNVFVTIDNAGYSEEMQEIFDNFGIEANVRDQSGNTRIDIDSNEINVPAIEFAYIDTKRDANVELGNRQTIEYHSSNSVPVFKITTSREKVLRSMSIKDSFLGQLEDEASDRDTDISTDQPEDIPSQDEFKEAVFEMCQELEDGLGEISSHKVLIDGQEYTAIFTAKDNMLKHETLLDIMVEFNNKFPEQFGGLPGDLQGGNPRVVCR